MGALFDLGLNRVGGAESTNRISEKHKSYAEDEISLYLFWNIFF